MLQTGMSSRAVTCAVNLCNSTILRLCALFQQTGDVSERQRTGRPRDTTPAHDRLIFLCIINLNEIN